VETAADFQLPRVLFEDERILAVDKPSGVPSHSLSQSSGVSSSATPSVEARLKAARGDRSVWLLHRLDTGTSGVLLFAKDESTYNTMREKFRARAIHKEYRAWSEGRPEATLSLPAEITDPLAHHPKSKKRMIVLPEGKNLRHRGKPLAAHTRILAIGPAVWEGKPVTEIRVQIITGVMHQIRVHLKSVGYPLVGDPIYGPRDTGEAPPRFSRLGLHAERISFELDGFLYQIEAPLPK